jgi:DNA-binding CsgD family transcriptional regulator
VDVRRRAQVRKDIERAQVRKDIERVSHQGLDWVTLAREVSALVDTVVPFDRSCWHTVDPGTVLFTGSVNRNVGCSGAWLAEHEYVIEDVNKWSFLALSGRKAGATSLATHGDLGRSARHRSQAALGIGDELRGSFVKDGDYWGAAGFLRDADRPHFSEDDVTFLASLSGTLADGVRRALVARAIDADVVDPADSPGIVIFDGDGHPEMISPAAEHWIGQLVEEPPPDTPADSKLVQAVAARARVLGPGDDPIRGAARSRARTRGGTWLVLYGTPLAGGTDRRTAVVIQPAAPHEVAPLVALAYGLTDRECQIVRHCMEGRPTKQIARELHVSAYTVQDHLKSIFAKTGVRTRNELIGQIFLEHYASRWEEAETTTGEWIGWRAPDAG